MGRRGVTWAATCLLLACCGFEGNGTQDTDSTGTDSAGTDAANTDQPTTGEPSSSSGPTQGTDDDGDGSSSGDEVTSGQPPVDPAEPAGGIRVRDVELNQGVGIALVQVGDEVSIDDRSAPIIAGRDALIRIGYALSDDFEPRDIEARVWIDNQAWVHVRPVMGPPNWNAFDGTMHVVVDGDALTADSSIRVELVEVDGGPTIGTANGASFPPEGSIQLGAWAGPMVLDIVLVPFTCDGVPDLDITNEDLANFEAFLFNTYPVQALNLTVHEPVHSTSCSEFDAAESDLPALRDAENAEPWVYYGGLLPGEGGGYSISTQDSDQMDYRRTFANHAWRDEGLTADLFAHELGHNHGREHSFEDPDFPTATGNWCGPRSGYGWGPRSSQMPTSGYSNDVELGLMWFDPHENILRPTDSSCDGLPEGNRYNYNDFMSYTYPFWVSEYTYAAAADRIRLISSWRGQAISPPQGRTARLIVGPQGKLHRTTFTGSRTVTSADTWALCGDTRVPVRTTTSTLEHPDHTREVFMGYELPLHDPAGVHDDLDARTCVLDVDGLRVPFAVE